MSEFNGIIIDAHVHLWEIQDGCVDRKPVRPVGNGKTCFVGETRQMMPPYIADNRNTAELLIANMDYARVNACAVTQEYLDGNQDEYLLSVRKKYPDRFRITALYEDRGYIDDRNEYLDNGSYKGFSGSCIDRICNENDAQYFDGIKICAGRLKDKDLTHIMDVFKTAEKARKYIAIDLADGDEQTESMQAVIKECPDLRIAVGHFGMVTTHGWQKQIELACNRNVYIESGGLTWLFHKEFYPYPSAIKAILEARDICGIEKLMWGSDYPRTMTDITYKSAVRFIIDSPELTDREKRLFMGENAAGFYGFTGLEPMPEIDNML